MFLRFEFVIGINWYQLVSTGTSEVMFIEPSQPRRVFQFEHKSTSFVVIISFLSELLNIDPCFNQ